MSEYQHKGVTINFRVGDARFDATVGEKRITAPSLDAIKKKIDAEQAIKFEPFKAVEYREGVFTSFTVMHTAKSEQRHARGDTVFVTDHPSRYKREQHNVTPDTPENRALLKAAGDKWVEVCAETRRLEIEVEAARQAVPTVSVRDYGVTK